MKSYVIIDVRSNPTQFISEQNDFVIDFELAKRFDIEEGTAAIDGFNKIGELIGSNGKDFMPGLIHINNFKAH